MSRWSSCRRAAILLGDFERSAPTHVYSEPETTPQDTEPEPASPSASGGRRDRAPGISCQVARTHQRDWALKLITAFRPDVIVRQYHFPIPHFDSIESLNIPSVQSVLLYGAGFAQLSDEDAAATDQTFGNLLFVRERRCATIFMVAGVCPRIASQQFASASIWRSGTNK